MTHPAGFFVIDCSDEISNRRHLDQQHRCLLSNREYRPRENVTFLENGTKVYALNPKSFVFVREKSVGDPEVDIVRTINIPYVVSRACAGGQPHCGTEPPVFGSHAHLSHNWHVTVLAVLLYPTQRAPVCDVKMQGCHVWVGKLKGGHFDVPSVLQLVSTLFTALECRPHDAGQNSQVLSKNLQVLNVALFYVLTGITYVQVTQGHLSNLNIQNGLIGLLKAEWCLWPRFVFSLFRL